MSGGVSIFDSPFNFPTFKEFFATSFSLALDRFLLFESWRLVVQCLLGLHRRDFPFFSPGYFLSASNLRLACASASQLLARHNLSADLRASFSWLLTRRVFGSWLVFLARLLVYLSFLDRLLLGSFGTQLGLIFRLFGSPSPWFLAGSQGLTWLHKFLAQCIFVSENSRLGASCWFFPSVLLVGSSHQLLLALY